MNQPVFDMKHHTDDLEKSEDAFTAFRNTENTLIFVSSGYQSFQIWKQEDTFLIRLRTRTGYGNIFLQEKRSISKHAALAAGKEILDYLNQYRFALSGTGKGDVRLYFNTRQLFCDSRWEQYERGDWIQPVLDILFRVFASAAPLGQTSFTCGDPMGGYPEQKKRMAELADHELKLVLRSSNFVSKASFSASSVGSNRSDYTLEAEALINRNDNCWRMRETVELPADAAQELFDWLLECGIMEALIKRSARKPEPVRDHGLTLIHWVKYNTVFHLQTDDLTYDYEDGSKTETDQERRLMRQAMEHILDVFARCRADEAEIK